MKARIQARYLAALALNVAKKDEFRYYFRGVNFRFGSAVATNGHSLTMAKLENSAGPRDSIITIPSTLLRELKKKAATTATVEHRAGRGTATVTVEFNGSAEPYTESVPVIDGKFPELYNPLLGAAANGRMGLMQLKPQRSLIAAEIQENIARIAKILGEYAIPHVIGEYTDSTIPLTEQRGGPMIVRYTHCEGEHEILSLAMPIVGDVPPPIAIPDFVEKEYRKAVAAKRKADVKHHEQKQKEAA